MAVDATVFVLASYSSDVGYVVASFKLNRGDDFQLRLQKVEKGGKPWKAVQLPCGSWSKYSDGTGLEDEFEEGGYLFTDAYDAPLTSVMGHSYSAFAEEPGLNGAVFAFVCEHYPDHDVVILWH